MVTRCFFFSTLGNGTFISERIKFWPSGNGYDRNKRIQYPNTKSMNYVYMYFFNM